jgi:hypothetical protein
MEVQCTTCMTPGVRQKACSCAVRSRTSYAQGAFIAQRHRQYARAPSRRVGNLVQCQLMCSTHCAPAVELANTMGHNQLWRAHHFKHATYSSAQYYGLFRGEENVPQRRLYTPKRTLSKPNPHSTYPMPSETATVGKTCQVPSGMRLLVNIGLQLAWRQ